MDSFKRNIAVKTTAVILSYIFAMLTIISSVSVGIMVYMDFYTCDYETARTNIMSGLAENEIFNAFSKYYNIGNIDEYYRDKNISVQIADTEGELLYDNYDESKKYVASASGIFKKEDEGASLEIVDSDFNVHGYFSGEGEGSTALLSSDITVTVFVPQLSDMKFTDRFYIVQSMVEKGYKLRYDLIFLAVLSLALSTALIIFLFCAAGLRKGQKKPVLNMVDRIPFDLRLAAAFVVGCFYVLLYDFVGVAVVYVPAGITLLYFMLLGLSLSAATLLKKKCFLQNTLIYRALRVLKRLAKYLFGMLLRLFKRLPVIYKAVALLAAYVIIELIIFMSFWYEQDVLFFYWFCKNLLLAVAVILYASGFSRIKEMGKQVENGDIDAKVDTSFMFGDLRSAAESLNNISNGLNNAINDKMHSERLKTELITNVSHDIKTPLTSIISYVDLLSREELGNDTAREYVAVLDRQSKRLKKLTDDLVEASKASTGNLSVELAPCDVRVLVSQAVGEYDERFAAHSLTAVCDLPEMPLVILADGRRLWRVFDNLMSNICKYTQEGTRVYISAERQAEKIKIVFKNISKYPLNILGDELTERFVRGDTSRNTEGSGLGLSIARSLTELQNGKMDIVIDGDLFKAVITFDAIQGM